MNLHKLRIEGSCFNEPSELTFFEAEDRVSIVFGKNGSGKSTIAKCFRKLSGEEIEENINADPVDENGNVITLSDSEKRTIYVFDEDFVDGNVKFRNEELQSIVLLGEAGDLQASIDALSSEIGNIEELIGKTEDRLSKYCGDSTDSPDLYSKRIKAILQKDDGWAVRAKNIRDNKNKASVTEEVIENIKNSRTKLKKEELKRNFGELLDQYSKIKQENSYLNSNVAPLDDSYLNYCDENISLLLAKKMEKPEMSEREKSILRLLENEGVEIIRKNKKIFSDADTKCCPYCLSELSDEYKTDLVQTLENILDNELEKHTQFLNQAKLEGLNYDFQQYDKLSVFNDCVLLADRINKKVSEINKVIDDKLRNPYVAISYKPDLESDISKFNVLLSNLTSEIKKFNEAVDKKNNIKRELENLNNQLAYLEIKSDLDLLTNKQAEKEQIIEELNKLKRNSELKQKEQIELKIKLKNTNLAVDDINLCLNYVFTENERLKIVATESGYKLTVRGEDVKPKDISVGERNILGLCYFFSHVKQNKLKNKAEEDEYFFVIDDPISSFDMENRVGICTLLRYEMLKFLLGNENTHIIIFSHEYQTVYDLHKAMKAINRTYRDKYKRNACSKYWHLYNHELVNLSIEKGQEYSSLIKLIYEFANSINDNYEIFVGNSVRRILEAFCTFEYCSNIDEFIFNERAEKQIKDEKLIRYFRSSMNQIILNTDSHYEQSIKSLNDNLNLFTSFDTEHKRQVARDALCLIYRLNPMHMQIRLKDYKDADKKILSWIEDIRSK